MLLSDNEKNVSELYGVSGMFGPARKTFIIGKDFTISRIFHKVDVTTHSKDILQELRLEDNPE